MEAWYPMIIWLISALVCGVVAHYRQVKATPTRQIIVALLGPLALPLVFLFRRDAASGSRAGTAVSDL